MATLSSTVRPFFPTILSQTVNHLTGPTYYMATAYTDTTSPNNSAVFKLVFAAGSQLHAATAPFLNSATTTLSGNNATLARIMTSYWISFAVTHDPNPLRSSDAPFWPSYSAGGPGNVASGQSVAFIVLAVTYNSISTVGDPEASVQCEFFGSRGYQVRN